MTARSFRLVASTVCAAALLAACGAERADDLLASAKTYLAKNDSKAAVIQLKNALQKSPDSAETRFLLGRTLLDSGDATSADVELRKALALGYPPVQVVPPLARALVAVQGYKKLVDEFGATVLTDREAAADLKTSLAIAHGALGAEAESAAALRAALEAVADYPRALVFRARREAAERRFDQAFASIDRVIAAHPTDKEALQFKGDLLLQARADTAAAVDVYRKALAVDPAYLPAHTGLIEAYFAKSDLTAAAAQVDELRKLHPNLPQTLYFEAQVAYLNNDNKKARDLMQRVLRVAPGNAKVLLLAGAVELKDQSLAQAEEYLNKSLQAAPSLTGARQLLAQTQIRAGQPEKALATLEPLLSMPKPDAETLSLAAQAEMQTGDLKRAEAYLVQAAEVDPTQTRSRVALALSRAKGGNIDAALGEIESIAAADSSSYADVVLINAYLRKQEFDKALAVADRLEKKDGGKKPEAANLRGRVQLQRKDIADARRSFERALSIDPAFLPAAANLALLDLADKQPDKAKQRFDGVLAADPKNLQALLALAGLRARAGGSVEEVAALLANAVKASPAEMAPRLALIDHYLAHRDAKRALTLAQDAVAALPRRPELLDALGRAQAAAGERNQAINSFTRLATLQPTSPQPLMRLAAVHAEANDTDKARDYLRRALGMRPDLLAAQRALIGIELAAKRPEEALTVARTVRRQRPAESVGYLLEGGVEASRKNFQAAVEAYRAGVKAAPSPELALVLHAAYGPAGQPAEADRFAASWLKEHPDDPRFMWHLGSVALEKRDYRVAEDYFQRVHRLQPDNVPALNNLAWVTAELGKPGAVAYAEKANALMPDKPVLLDTLAHALASEKQFDKAIETEKRALVLAPDAHDLRLALAKLYIRSGDKAAARAELDRLAKLEGKFAAQQEVGRLLQTL